MQGFSPTPSPPPNLTLPRPNRIKRGRVLSPDLDVDLDCYFRSKRFMTESVTKEMEDVAISDPPLTTSPSRTSTLTRLAEKGPSRSNVASVIDFDAPKLSIGTGGRRRHLVVTNANEVSSPRSHGEGSLSGSGGMKLSDFEDEEDEEEDETYFSPLEWRLPPSSPRTTIPRPIPVESALKRLIEKKQEAEAKQVVVYRSPSDIIKGAAQNALYARLRSNSPSSSARHVFGDPYSIPGTVQSSFPASTRYPASSLARPIMIDAPRPRSSLIVEELPDDAPSTPPLSSSGEQNVGRSPSYADFMAIDDDPMQSFSPSDSGPSLRTSGSFSRAAAQLGQFSGFGGGFPLNRSSSFVPRSPNNSPPPPRYSMFSDNYMDSTPEGMDISSTPPNSSSTFMTSQGGFMGHQ